MKKITNDVRCTRAIPPETAMSKEAFNKMTLFTSKLNLNLRNCISWIALYSAETWTLRNTAIPKPEHCGTMPQPEHCGTQKYLSLNTAEQCRNLNTAEHRNTSVWTLRNNASTWTPRNTAIPQPEQCGKMPQPEHCGTQKYLSLNTAEKCLNLNTAEHSNTSAWTLRNNASTWTPRNTAIPQPEHCENTAIPQPEHCGTQQYLESFKMLGWRNTEKKSWTDSVKNEVLHTAKVKKKHYTYNKRNEAWLDWSHSA